MTLLCEDTVLKLLIRINSSGCQAGPDEGVHIEEKSTYTSGYPR